MKQAFLAIPLEMGNMLQEPQHMARRKKQKAKTDRPEEKRPGLEKQQSNKSGQDKSASQKPISSSPAGPERQKGETAGSVQERRGSGVSLSTCIAGMFLTLVLGMYLGTLFPGVLENFNTAKKDAPVAPAPSMPPSGSQAPQAGNGDNGLAGIVRNLEKTVAERPDDGKAWIELGNAYFDSGKPALSISAYERALKFYPDDANVWTDLGIMHRENGNPQKALECFQKAISINPAHQNAMFNEGVVLATDLNRKADAAQAWQRLLNVNPMAKAPDGASLADMIKNLR